MVRYQRTSGIVSEAALQFPIQLIGCGGIGSLTALILAQMGCRSLTILDPDVVEEQNLAYQVFPVDSPGTPKVQAVTTVLRTLCDYVPTMEQRRVTGSDTFQGVVISAVDSLEARRDLWRGVVNNPAVPLYIDGRMAGEEAEILIVDPSRPADVAFYEEVLSRVPVPDACSARGIAYGTYATAALIANLVKRFAMGNTVPIEIRLDFRSLALAFWNRAGEESADALDARRVEAVASKARSEETT